MAYESYGFNQNKTKKDLSKLDIDYIESMIESRISNIENNFLMKMYPVNSLYFSPDNKNPASVLGFGTWSSYSDAQRFLVISPGKPQYSSSAEAGNMKTGGSNMITLKDENLPRHSHMIVTENAPNSSKGETMTTYPPWRKIHIVRRGSALWTGDYEKNPVWGKQAGFKFWVRRGRGSGTVTVGNSIDWSADPKFSGQPTANGGCTVKREDGDSYNSDPATPYPDRKMSMSYEVYDDRPEAHYDVQDTRKFPDSVELNITQNCRIEGFTDNGIYNEEQWHYSINNKAMTPLSQKQIDNRPAYITVYCWIRTA